MKKLICLLITITMMLGLAACGQSNAAQGNNIYASAKGIGTKTVTLKLSGTFPEDAELVIEVPSMIQSVDTEEETTDTAEEPAEVTTEESEEVKKEKTEEELKADQEALEAFLAEAEKEAEALANIDNNHLEIISVQQKSLKKNSATYKIKGVATGTGTLTFKFVKDDVVQSKVVVNVVIDQDLKITTFDMVVNEDKEVEIIDLGDGSFMSLQTFTSTNYAKVTFDGKYQNWRIDSCDEDYLYVLGPNEEDDERTSFEIYGVSEGTGSFFLNYNNEKLVNVAFDINSIGQAEVEMGESSETQIQELYDLVYIGAFAEEVDHSLTMDQITSGLSQAVSSKITLDDGTKVDGTTEVEVVEGLTIPEGASVSEIGSYQLGKGENSSNDSVSMDLNFDDVEMFYDVTKGKTLKTFDKELKSDKDVVIASEDEFTVNGITVKYYRLEFAIAAWENNDALHVLTMLTNDGSGDKALIEAFIKAQ